MKARWENRESRPNGLTGPRFAVPPGTGGRVILRAVPLPGRHRQEPAALFRTREPGRDSPARAALFRTQEPGRGSPARAVLFRTRASGKRHPCAVRHSSSAAGRRQAPPPKPVKRRPPLSAAERRRRRRRRMFFFYIFLFLAVIGTAVTLSLTVLFRVERIEVQGESRYSAEQIVQASGLETGGNLF